MAAMASRPSSVLTFQVNAARSRQKHSSPNSAAAPPLSREASAELNAASQASASVYRGSSVIPSFPKSALTLFLRLESLHQRRWIRRRRGNGDADVRQRIAHAAKRLARTHAHLGGDACGDRVYHRHVGV